MLHLIVGNFCKNEINCSGNFVDYYIVLIMNIKKTPAEAEVFLIIISVKINRSSRSVSITSGTQ